MNPSKPDPGPNSGKPENGQKSASDAMVAPSANSNGQTDSAALAAKQILNPKKEFGRYFSKSIRILIFLSLIIGFIITGAYFLLRGQVINNAALNGKVVASLQEIVGDEYSINIEQTEVFLDSLTNASLTGKNIEIRKNDSAQKIATLETIDLLIDPISIIRNAPQIDGLTLSGIQVNLSNSTKPLISLQKELGNLGAIAAKLQMALAKSDLEKISIHNLRVDGAVLGRKNPTPLLFENVQLFSQDNGYFTLQTNLQSDQSNPLTMAINANWQKVDELNYLKMNATNLDISHWVDLPSRNDETKASSFGSNAIFDLSAEFPFSLKNEPLQPIIKAKAASSSLRIGDKHQTKLDSVDLNFRLLPKSNQIQIERSSLLGEGVDIYFVAGIIPADESLGFSGPLNFDLVAENIKVDSLNKGGNPIVANALILGEWDSKTKQAALDSITLSTEKQKIYGSAVVTFGGKSSAIKGSFESPEFSLIALRHLWPFYMAPNIRDWLREKTNNGSLKNTSLVLNIPQGRLYNLRNHIPYEAQEIKLTTNFEGVSIDTFGQVAPIQNANGSLIIEGSSLITKLNDGSLISPGNNQISLNEGNVSINNYTAKHPKVYLDAHLNGKLSTTMAIANSAPLKAADKALVKPADLSGNALVDIVTTFNLLPKSQIENLDWNALVTLQKASSDQKVFGHALKNADMLLEITPNEVRGSGSAILNGAKSDISFVEPLGKNATVKSAFNLATSLSQKQLIAQGLDLSPIVKGDLDIKVETLKSGEQRYNIDLTKSDISLPWIGWFKGVGIAAKAGFILNKRNGINTLKNFSISGKGLSAKGVIAFNKAGLVTANLQNVSLVGTEKFNVKIEKAKSRYVIDVTGNSFDGRSVINKFLHTDEFNAQSEGLDVTLNASLSAIKGFGNKTLKNASVKYRTDNGFVSLLEIKGILNSGVQALIDARRKGEVTTFDLSSQNAGEAFAFLDVYRKMEGGTLSTKLVRSGNGPFRGTIKLRGFTITGEEKLQAFSNAPAGDSKLQKATGELKKINTNRVRFRSAFARIEKGDKYLKVSEGIIRSNEIGFTYEGDVYDTQNQMHIRGTFMPVIALSRLIGVIPVIGQIFSNGRDSALIGIAYRLRGSVKKPQLDVNPMSLVTPGIFNKVFEFKE